VPDFRTKGLRYKTVWTKGKKGTSVPVLNQVPGHKMYPVLD